MQSKQHRNLGSALILFICIACCVFIPLLMLLSQFGSLSLMSTRTQNTLEAACLLAARDVSRIVIDDPSFGYVSLSNYPPVGKHTLASDGEPLPVIAINTLVGTVRLNTIVADLLKNDTMSALAKSDHLSLEMTKASLNSALAACLRDQPNTQWLDIDAAPVTPAADVRKFLQENLPFGAKIESVRLTNGWLSHGGKTTVPVPQPERLANINPSDAQLGEYKPFIDIPASNKSFTFAGVGSSPSLCNPSYFHNADDKHICSIIKIDCSISFQNPFRCLFPGQTTQKTVLQFSACAEPYSNPDIAPPGVMTLRFSNGSVPNIRCWNDLLSDTAFSDNQVLTYDVVGGDYPVDSNSRMKLVQDERTTTSQQLANHLYYWLRNGHVNPRLDAVLSMLQDQFLPGNSGHFYIYEFVRDGSIYRKNMDRNPFTIGVTSDAQTEVIADTRLRGGIPAILIFRDNVKRLGNSSGGKHAGQPLAGSPLNWCELQAFGGDDLAAGETGKGKRGTRLKMTSTDCTGQETQSANRLFQLLDGTPLARQPRSNYFSGGLALDIEFGGTRPSNPSKDIASMHRFCSSRKI